MLRGHHADHERTISFRSTDENGAWRNSVPSSVKISPGNWRQISSQGLEFEQFPQGSFHGLPLVSEEKELSFFC